MPTISAFDPGARYDDADREAEAQRQAGQDFLMRQALQASATKQALALAALQTQSQERINQQQLGQHLIDKNADFQHASALDGTFAAKDASQKERDAFELGGKKDLLGMANTNAQAVANIGNAPQLGELALRGREYDDRGAAIRAQSALDAGRATLSAKILGNIAGQMGFGDDAPAAGGGTPDPVPTPAPTPTPGWQPPTLPPVAPTPAGSVRPSDAPVGSGDDTSDKASTAAAQIGAWVQARKNEAAAKAAGMPSPASASVPSPVSAAQLAMAAGGPTSRAANPAAPASTPAGKFQFSPADLRNFGYSALGQTAPVDPDQQLKQELNKVVAGQLAAQAASNDPKIRAAGIAGLKARGIDVPDGLGTGGLNQTNIDETAKVTSLVGPEVQDVSNYAHSIGGWIGTGNEAHVLNSVSSIKQKLDTYGVSAPIKQQVLGDLYNTLTNNLDRSVYNLAGTQKLLTKLKALTGSTADVPQSPTLLDVYNNPVVAGLSGNMVPAAWSMANGLLGK